MTSVPAAGPPTSAAGMTTTHPFQWSGAETSLQLIPPLVQQLARSSEIRVKKELERKTTEKTAPEQPPLLCVRGSATPATRVGADMCVPHAAPALLQPPCCPACGSAPCSCLLPALPLTGDLDVDRRDVWGYPGYVLNTFFPKHLRNPLNQRQRCWKSPCASPNIMG